MRHAAGGHSWRLCCETVSSAAATLARECWRTPAVCFAAACSCHFTAALVVLLAVAAEGPAVLYTGKYAPLLVKDIRDAGGQGRCGGVPQQPGSSSCVGLRDADAFVCPLLPQAASSLRRTWLPPRPRYMSPSGRLIELVERSSC